MQGSRFGEGDVRPIRRACGEGRRVGEKKRGGKIRKMGESDRKDGKGIRDRNGGGCTPLFTPHLLVLLKGYSIALVTGTGVRLLWPWLFHALICHSRGVLCSR